MCVAEKARLESMKRAVRGLGIGLSKAKLGNGHVNGVQTNGVHKRMDINMGLSEAVVEQSKVNRIIPDNIAPGLGAVEDPEREGMILSNGKAPAEDAPPADELAQEALDPPPSTANGSA
ncbi:hypothetical protein P3342_003199 [Pyrenophora teres f. teres]|nr:hypothetical protein P3342_003199 [Pyrenophora teres f. teres]